METKIQVPKPEVAVRTLSSDIGSIEAGNQKPIAKLMFMDLSREDEEDDQMSGQPKKSHAKQIILSLILLSILVIGYFFIYPMLKEAFYPSVVDDRLPVAGN